ncbi:U4/U6.U5 tri-snRNP-associated protein 1 [Strongyloides ratti]|uniref:U4/U6.U5 tri-snRNP-associated protein 1 n=1 Tax=Strongyloides ratti TaxID=34506 RepID=A0A090MRM3_STRRB|nr:U4/U6.U5 tri-snRNP-associated protein 1 [Strongyloides ratti]CEF60883.1 U4/U6.U5 tri-snRNP-associated protein 1 [Strongyloides ratti]
MSDRKNRKRKNLEDDSFENDDISQKKCNEDKNLNNDGAESLSIEETNRIRAELGLAPLEINDNDKKNEPKIGKNGEKIIIENGVEIHCKPSENLTLKKESEKIKERLETNKRKRHVYEKVLKKDKGLADSDSDEDVNNWLEKTKSKILSKESAYDELDEQLVNAGKIESEKLKKKKERRKKIVDNDITASGLIVGHSKESFLDGTNTILVLQDKHVLDDNEDEVLINPNLIDNETAQRNVRLRKNQNHYNDLTEDYDEWGNPIDKGVLSKYDEVLEGEKKEMFRLDDDGCMDVEKEAKELEIKKKLHMERLKLQSLETDKYKLASDFYTEDEILSFRKPKKKKNKGKKLKIIDEEELLPEVQDTEIDKREKAIRLAKRNEGQLKMKVVDNCDIGGNTINLRKFLNDDNDEKMEANNDESDEELKEHIKMASIVIEDDFESELNDILNRTRKLKQLKNITEEKKDIGLQTTEMLKKLKEVKKEVTEDTGFIIDSTTEYCRHIGDFDNNVVKQEYNSDEEMDVSEKSDGDEEDRLNKKFSKDNFKEASTGSSLQIKKEDDDDDEFKDYVNVFGKEDTTSRGIGGMLKLAGQKGYFENKKIKKEKEEKLTNSNLLLPPSKIKVDKSHVEDDAFTKKMDKIVRSKAGRGGGPIFEDKLDYNPQVTLSYADSRGRELNPKQAFRELSWKFHGKAPGKKQTEKRLARFEKEDKIKKMNSCFTPVDFKG